MKTEVEQWSLGEKICLAASVLLKGENWSQVSKNMESWSGSGKSSEWYSQNCASQYADLIEKYGGSKKKRELARESVLRKLTIERINDLVEKINLERENYAKLKQEVELIEAHKLDHRVEQIWNKMQSESPEKETVALPENIEETNAVAAEEPVVVNREVEQTFIKTEPATPLSTQIDSVDTTVEETGYATDVSRDSSVKIDSFVAETQPVTDVTMDDGENESSNTAVCKMEVTNEEKVMEASLDVDSEKTSTPLGSDKSDCKDVEQTVKVISRSTVTGGVEVVASELGQAEAVEPFTVVEKKSEVMTSDVDNIVSKDKVTPEESKTAVEDISSWIVPAPKRPLVVNDANNQYSSHSWNINAKRENSRRVNVLETEAQIFDVLAEDKSIISDRTSRKGDLLKEAPTEDVVVPREDVVQDPSETKAIKPVEVTEEPEAEIEQPANIDVYEFVADEEDTGKPAVIPDEEQVTEESAQDTRVIQASNIPETIQSSPSEILEDSQPFIPSPAAEKKITKPPQQVQKDRLVTEKEPLTVRTGLLKEKERLVSNEKESWSLQKEKDRNLAHKEKEKIVLKECIKVEDLKPKVIEDISLPRQNKVRSMMDKTTDVSEPKEVSRDTLPLRLDSLGSIASQPMSPEVKKYESKFLTGDTKRIYKTSPSREMIKLDSFDRTPLREESSRFLRFDSSAPKREDRSNESSPRCTMEKQFYLSDSSRIERKATSRTRILSESEFSDGGSKSDKSFAWASTSEYEDDRSDKKISKRKHVSPNETPLSSTPNSPASSISNRESDFDDRAYKTWKKAIMLVWREIAQHKYASIFLQPITDKDAPGYHNVVNRPVDLQKIKRNIECGTLRTTSEFQREILLMFLNAIMYNSSDHDVYAMAKEMQQEAISIIQGFLNTQLLMKTAEILKTSRRETRESSSKKLGSPTPDEESTSKRKRSSSFAVDEKLAKRKRTDKP